MKRSIYLLALLALIQSCKLTNDLTIPTEPTIWIVSEIKQDRRLENGLVGYLMVPVNPGTINMKPVWVLDYSGKYYVGQRVDFAPFTPEEKGVQ